MVCIFFVLKEFLVMYVAIKIFLYTNMYRILEVSVRVRGRTESKRGKFSKSPSLSHRHTAITYVISFLITNNNNKNNDLTTQEKTI